jgi:hypothetical protein
MSNQKRDYDTTLARIAGNIAAGMMGGFAMRAESHGYEHTVRQFADDSVELARAIVAEVKRSEPKEPPAANFFPT